MKKIMMLLLVCATVFVQSCRKEHPALAYLKTASLENWPYPTIGTAIMQSCQDPVWKVESEDKGVYTVTVSGRVRALSGEVMPLTVYFEVDPVEKEIDTDKIRLGKQTFSRYSDINEFWDFIYYRENGE